MSLEAREDYLAKMESSRFFLYRDLLLLAKTLAMVGYARDPRVQSIVGYESKCAVREGSPAPEVGSLGDLEPSGESEDADVVIVGSGAGGAVAATVLAEAGLDVVVLEAGEYLNRDNYPAEPLEALPRLYRDGGLTIAQGRPAIPIPVGRVVGGTTVINSGTCFRAPDDVLRAWRDEAGIPWTTDLDAEFADGERTLQVKQVPEADIGRNGQLCAEGARAIGASGASISRNAGDCIQCSSCPLGCRIDAKRAMHVSYLPRAVAAGARIRAGVQVDEITSRDGRATGIRGRGRGAPVHGPRRHRDRRRRRPRHARAPAAIGPRRRARGSPPPHPSCRVDRRALSRAGPGLGGDHAELLRRRVARTGPDPRSDLHPALVRRPVAAGGRARAPGAPRRLRPRRVDRRPPLRPLRGPRRLPGGRLTYKLSAEEARTIHYGIARAAEIHFAAGATEVYPQLGPVQVIPRGKLADFEAMDFRPGDLRLEAFHPMGTARMGSNPSKSVTGTDGAVRGVEGVYVADASLLPSSVGVNPMMTIIAFSAKVAQQIAERSARPRRAEPIPV